MYICQNDVVISMMTLGFRLGLVAGYLGLKLNKFLSQLHLTYKLKEI